MIKQLVVFMFAAQISEVAVSKSILLWPETIHAQSVGRCPNFNDEYFFVTIDINTEAQTYEKSSSFCLSNPSVKIWGTIEKEGDTLQKKLSKKCLNYSDNVVCTEFGSIPDGRLQMEDPNTLIEFANTGEIIRRYTIAP